MGDVPNVASDSNGSGIAIPSFVEPMEMQPRAVEVLLKVDGPNINGLLINTRDPVNASVEIINDTEFHKYQPITRSARYLCTHLGLKVVNVNTALPYSIFEQRLDLRFRKSTVPIRFYSGHYPISYSTETYVI